MFDTVEEEWKDLFDFSNYKISNFGRVYNIRRNHIMSTSFTPFGHLKITLKSDYDGERYTRSVAQLVAEAFVEPPNALCDHVVVLDGIFSNVVAYNLMWRPQWFVWKYTRQLKINQPIQYLNLQCINLVTNEIYESVVDAGMSEGLLFGDVWRSAHSGAALFPTGSIFEFLN